MQLSGAHVLVTGASRGIGAARRRAPVLAFDWLPRRVADLVLTGVPRR